MDDEGGWSVLVLGEDVSLGRHIRLWGASCLLLRVDSIRGIDASRKSL